MSRQSSTLTNEPKCSRSAIAEAVGAAIRRAVGCCGVLRCLELFGQQRNVALLFSAQTFRALKRRSQQCDLFRVSRGGLGFDQRAIQLLLQLLLSALRIDQLIRLPIDFLQ